MTDRNESPDDQLNEYPVESFNLDDIFLMQFSESEEPKMKLMKSSVKMMTTKYTI